MSISIIKKNETSTPWPNIDKLSCYLIFFLLLIKFKIIQLHQKDQD